MKTIKGNLVLTKDTVFRCDLKVEGNIVCKGGPWNISAGDISARDISAWDISAWNISAWDISAWNISAGDISARDISYYAVCFAYHSIECDSIKGRRDKHRHFCLDGKVKIRKKKEDGD